MTGGELRFEVDGSTDMAAWVRLADVPDPTRVDLVDVGLAANLHRWDTESSRRASGPTS